MGWVLVKVNGILLPLGADEFVREPPQCFQALGVIIGQYALSILLVFPGIVFLGAVGAVHSAQAQRLCLFLGDISYPIYITHYPLIYTYTTWVATYKVFLRDGLPVAALVFLAAVSIAYACLRFYDEPVRAWLKKKVLVDGGESQVAEVAAVIK